MNDPQVSVVMPVFNRQQYVGAAIESILAQTITDFELIIVDDGSTDQSMAVIQGYRDPRIRLIRFSQNKGGSKARNVGNREARGEFIAVMDSDDIALPGRLEMQLAFMKAHPDVGICGASVRWVDETLHHMEDGPAVTGPERCLAKLTLLIPFCHPTLMVRRSVYSLVPYETRWEPIADYGFLTHAAHVTKIDAIKDVVLLMRSHPLRISVLMMERQDDVGGEISALYLTRMGLALDERQRALWKKFRRPRNHLFALDELAEMSQLGARLLEANAKSGLISHRYLQAILAGQWWHVARVSPLTRSLAFFHIYRHSPLKRRGLLQPLYDLRMLTLCLGLGRGIRIVQWLERLKMRLVFLRS
jgi:glycosyltransferase involved in cell wall biosynthesis